MKKNCGYSQCTGVMWSVEHSCHVEEYIRAIYSHEIVLDTLTLWRKVSECLLPIN